VSSVDHFLQREAMARLSHVHGPGEIRAAILALVAPPDSVPSFMAWTAETQGCTNAPLLREEVMHVGDSARLPCLEALLQRMKASSEDDRRALLKSMRRLVSAIQPMRPLDRLHWLLVRRRLGEHLPMAALPDAHNRLDQLPALMIVRLASVAAYLSRMVPGLGPEHGLAWYRAAMAPIVSADSLPPFLVPDGDGLTRALVEVEALPLMLRPVLMRAWVEAAFVSVQRARLLPGAADALRLFAGLLESPLPPELGRHFVETGWDDQPT